MLLRFTTFFLVLTLFCQCKKGGTDTETAPSAAQKVQREHGQPIGTATKQTIGTAGGSITAADGGLVLTIPAGAVETPLEFSIQPVENKLETGSKAYRLLPEGTVFKKPVTLTYTYASAGISTEEAAYLFMVYQDAAGYYHQAKNLQHSAITKTLVVQTNHFSDWTFASRIQLKTDRTPNGGTVELKKGESVTLTLSKYYTDEKTTDAYDDSAPLLEDLLFADVAKISWSKTGSGTVSANKATAQYTAPAFIPSGEELLVTATVTDPDLGRDNNGQVIRQMILSQPVVLLPESEAFFEVTEDGTKYQLKNARVSFVPGFVTINGAFLHNSNTITLTLKDPTGAGNYVYGMPGLAGKASIDYIATGLSVFVHFRPDDCTNGKEIHYADGQVSITKLAAAVGEYTEGSFTGQVYDVMWCSNGQQKTLSGRFKIRKNF
jgi:hypothetical protein